MDWKVVVIAIVIFAVGGWMQYEKTKANKELELKKLEQQRKKK